MLLCQQRFLPTKVFANKSQSYGFSTSHEWMWELDHKESWAPKNWCFFTVVLTRLLRVPWTARSNQSILKEISPECSLEGLMLKATWCEELTHWERPRCWERLKAGGEGDDREWDGWMASPTQWTWVWASLGVADGQESLARCSPWGQKESDINEQLNWTELPGQESTATQIHFLK